LYWLWGLEGSMEAEVVEAEVMEAEAVEAEAVEADVLEADVVGGSKTGTLASVFGSFAGRSWETSCCWSSSFRDFFGPPILSGYERDSRKSRGCEWCCSRQP
jgi:hypothetical protein